MLRAVIARASREMAPGRLATPGATGPAVVTACAAAAAAGVGAGRPRAFTARPDTPPSVIPEHGDFSDSQSQVKQPGKERPLEGDAAELRGRAEAEMAGRNNVAAEGARVMGSAHLKAASHSPPQMNPRGASGGITRQNVSSADPSSSTGGSDGALRQSDPAPPTGPGFSGDGTAAAGGGIGDGLSADYMNSTDAGEDVELMKGRLAQLERAGADGDPQQATKSRPGQTPMSP